MSFARDLDSNDNWLVRNAAREGLTSWEFAEKMSIRESQVWRRLYERGQEAHLEMFLENNRKWEEREGRERPPQYGA